MRWLWILPFIALSFGLQAAGTISVAPTLPFPNTPVTFILTATPAPIGAVTWDFGNGQGSPGGTVTTYTYPSSGLFTVRATYQVFNIQQVPVTQTAQVQLRVADRKGPAAPFSISSLRLRWESGAVNLSVPKGFSPLTAYLDLRFEGTGLLQMQWTVDGVPLGTMSEQLAFAGSRTLDSARILSLPTQELGEHVVSLRILAPQTSMPIPEIRYIVGQESTEILPRVETISPSVLHAGDEAELWLTGPGLKPGVKVSFGRDIAIVSALRFPGPGTVVAKVFVAPNARRSSREVMVRSRSGTTKGPARLQILEPRQP